MIQLRGESILCLGEKHSKEGLKEEVALEHCLREELGMHQERQCEVGIGVCM